MALDSKKWMLIGKVLGGFFLVAAVIGVFFIKWKPEMEKVEEPVRPIKSMVLGEAEVVFSRTYPGRVRANQEVRLAFEVAGTLTNLFVKASDTVTNRQLLAALDSRDFEDAKDAADAELQRAEAHRERIRRARKKNAVSEQDLSDAEAAYNVAHAQLSIKSKALEDTRLRARFDGIISQRFIENFEGIQAKQPIFGLQSTNNVEVEVYLPESRIALFPRTRTEQAVDSKLFVAVFDYFPNRQFELKPKEFTTEADPETQTFKATFFMPLPDDLMILPGMTVTVYERAGMSRETEEGKAFSIPLDAVPVDVLGQYFVWLLEPDNGGYHKVKRQEVKVGKMIGNDIRVIGGLENGKRIALAGASVLKEGQQVRLLSSPDSK